MKVTDSQTDGRMNGKESRLAFTAATAVAAAGKGGEEGAPVQSLSDIINAI